MENKTLWDILSETLFDVTAPVRCPSCRGSGFYHPFDDNSGSCNVCQGERVDPRRGNDTRYVQSCVSIADLVVDFEDLLTHTLDDEDFDWSIDNVNDIPVYHPVRALVRPPVALTWNGYRYRIQELDMENIDEDEFHYRGEPVW